jgi:hypothetical protein
MFLHGHHSTEKDFHEIFFTLCHCNQTWKVVDGSEDRYIVGYACMKNNIMQKCWKGKENNGLNFMILMP